MNEDIKEIATTLCDIIRYLEYRDRSAHAEDLLLKLKRTHLPNLVKIINKDQNQTS